jgi:hypothetical protein
MRFWAEPVKETKPEEAERLMAGLPEGEAAHMRMVYEPVEKQGFPRLFKNVQMLGA